MLTYEDILNEQKEYWKNEDEKIKKKIGEEGFKLWRKEKDKQYQKEHREEINERAKKYYQEHKEELKKKKRELYQKKKLEKLI